MEDQEESKYDTEPDVVTADTTEIPLDDIPSTSSVSAPSNIPLQHVPSQDVRESNVSLPPPIKKSVPSEVHKLRDTLSRHDKPTRPSRNLTKLDHGQHRLLRLEPQPNPHHNRNHSSRSIYKTRHTPFNV